MRNQVLEKELGFFILSAKKEQAKRFLTYIIK
jgi:hypothetical protein